MKYKLIIFDLDGTILDTLEDLKNSLNHALRKNDLPERTLAEVRQFVGNGILKLIERAAPTDASADAVQKIFADFMAHYKLHCADLTRPYDGIPELIRALRKEGCLIAVVSNKADSAVQDLCRQYFPGLIDIAVGERENVKKKPAPDSVLEVMRQLNCTAVESVYIGDSEVDIRTACHAGIDAIIVEWGFRDRDFLILKGATALVHTPKEIITLCRADNSPLP